MLFWFCIAAMLEYIQDGYFPKNWKKKDTLDFGISFVWVGFLSIHWQLEL